MTSNIKRRLPGQSTPSRSQRAHDPEERFAQRVTLLFIGLIVAVVVIVVAAFAYDYYVGHLKPVASVGGASITRDQWTDRARLEDFRLAEAEKSTREQISAGTLSAEEGDARLTSISTARQNVATSSIENLIDLTFKGQLAEQDGLTVTDADVDEAIEEEATTPEARQISLIAVEPQAAGGVPTPAENQAAFRAAQDAKAALDAGTDFAEVAKLYSTDASADTGGDHGFITADSSIDPAFVGTIFALAQGETTPVIKGADGVWRIGRVDAIRAGSMGTGFEQNVRDAIGWDLYRGQVRTEVLAAALEDTVVADATTGDVPQVHLAEIVLEADTVAAPAEDEGTIRAAHILYSPNDDPNGAQALDAEDPAWAAAEAEARKAVDQLAKVTDPALRATAFATRAKLQSDDTNSGANGGDLGFFSRSMMVPEFADPLFDDDTLEPGDIVGPVKSAFGWHVIEFQERTPGVQTRIDEVLAKLAVEGADFGAVAKELSDGAEAPAGGDLGWQAESQVDPAVWTAVTALEAGAHTAEAIPLDDGYHFFQLIEQATRELDIQQRAIIADTAFADWFDPQKDQATTDGVITRDPDLFDSTPTVGG